MMKGQALLKFHEGERLTSYRDTRGLWTIGVGHLLPDPTNPKWKGLQITLEESERLFKNDINLHWAALEQNAPWVKTFDEVRRYVLMDMTFNLGIEPFDGDGIKDWPIFMSQLKARDWVAAAANMRSTLWARQVKGRALRLARMIETGTWPQEPGVPVIS